MSYLPFSLTNPFPSIRKKPNISSDNWKNNSLQKNNNRKHKKKKLLDTKLLNINNYLGKKGKNGGASWVTQLKATISLTLPRFHFPARGS